MKLPRQFSSAEHFTPAPGEPLRTVVAETTEAAIIAWHLEPGQTIPAHIHPHGQDTWTILDGVGNYTCDSTGNTLSLRAGDIMVARTGEVHGVYNPGPGPLRFISVVAPGNAGYQRLE